MRQKLRGRRRNAEVTSVYWPATPHFLLPTRRFLEGPEQTFEGTSRKLEGPSRKLEGLKQKFEGPEQKLEGLKQKLEGPEQKLEGLKQTSWEFQISNEKLSHSWQPARQRLSRMETDPRPASGQASPAASLCRKFATQ